MTVGDFLLHKRNENAGIMLESLQQASAKLGALGVTMQQALDNMKKFNSHFNRLGSIFNYQMDQQKATEVSVNMMSILDPYWSDKHDELFSMAQENSLTTALPFVECLRQIQRDILDGLTLEIENERAIKELKLLLLKGWYK